MANYELLPNEAVLIKDDRVYRERTSSRERGSSIDLILTNLNLVLVSTNTGFFKTTTETETFPINQIKVHNGQAQALLSKSGSKDVLDVYFIHGHEQFSFPNGGKRTIQTWIGKINEAVTGQPAPDSESSGSPGMDLVADALSSVPGGDRVAGVLKGTLGAFNSKRGAKPEPVVQIATKCVSCGAAVSGVQGQTVTCSYCLSAQQL
jgi:hypothetical protein